MKNWRACCAGSTNPSLSSLTRRIRRISADFAGEFHHFGYDEVFPVSAEHGLGFGDLLDAIIDRLPAVEVAEREKREIKVAIIGRPNVGKSSLINRLLGDERVIVSPIPGTTRDAVDTVVECQIETGERSVYR